MEAFTAFFEQEGKTYFRVECYMGNAMHFEEYVVEDEDALEKALGTTDCIPALTGRFSRGNAVLSFLQTAGVPFREIWKGFADTSSDV